MFPFSYSCSDVSPDEENHFEGVVGAAKALRAVHGRSFEVGSVCDVSLTAPGESIDWTCTSSSSFFPRGEMANTLYARRRRREGSLVVRRRVEGFGRVWFLAPAESDPPEWRGDERCAQVARGLCA